MAKTKKFKVTVKRIAHAYTEVEVEVPDTGNDTNDEILAQRKAIEEAGNREFGSGQAEYEVDFYSRVPNT